MKRSIVLGLVLCLAFATAANGKVIKPKQSLVFECAAPVYTSKLADLSYNRGKGKRQRGLFLSKIRRVKGGVMNTYSDGKRQRVKVFQDENEMVRVISNLGKNKVRYRDNCPKRKRV